MLGVPVLVAYAIDCVDVRIAIAITPIIAVAPADNIL